MDARFLHQHRIPDCRSVVSQDSERRHVHDRYRTDTGQLHPRLPLHMEWDTVEVWMPRRGVYAELLANSIIQEITACPERSRRGRFRVLSGKNSLKKR